MKRPVAVFGLALAMAALGAIALVAVTSATATSEPHKVFVCKYVGKPGVDERLQTGQNPISVDSNATVGTWFNDAQGRSYVLAVDDTEPGPAGDPDVSACPPPEGPSFSAEAVCNIDEQQYKVTGKVGDETADVDPETIAGDFKGDTQVKVSLGEISGEVKVTTDGKCVKDEEETGKLIVVKVVVNDDGGTKVASDFSFTVNGQTYAFESDGSNQLVLPVGDYTVGEVAAEGYTSSISDASVKIKSGKIVLVRVRNDDTGEEPPPPPPPPPHEVTGDASVICVLPDGSYRVSGTVDGQAADEVEPATIPGNFAGSTEVTVTRGDTSVRKTVTTDGKCSTATPPVVTPPAVVPPPVVTPPEVTPPAEPEGKPEAKPVAPKPAPLTPPTKKTTKKAPAQTKPAPLKPPKQAVAGAYAESGTKLAHTP